MNNGVKKEGGKGKEQYSDTKGTSNNCDNGVKEEGGKRERAVVVRRKREKSYLCCDNGVKREGGKGNGQ